MNHLLDGVEDENAGSRRDREITLGTTTLLGIFFGLAILCAAFFGFGYSMGAKHTTTAVTSNADPATLRSIPGSKPSSGNPYAVPQAGRLGSDSDPSTSTSLKASAPAPPGTTAPPEAFERDLPPTNSTLAKVSTLPPPAPAAALVVATSTGSAATGQSFIVQVAALSHQDDADLIQTTLQRRGYTVVVRPDASDHLLHVQVGPFNSRKDAEAMRQKLLGDGFNAYIK